LRGAVDASTKRVTVGGVEAQPESERMKTQTMPRIREDFIRWLRIMAVLITAVWNDGLTPAVLQNFRF
jgi:hypothetical protein